MAHPTAIAQDSQGGVSASAESRPAAEANTFEKWLCSFAIAFGIFLRVFRFWKPSLWIDEIATAYISSAEDLTTVWERSRLAWEFPVHHLLARLFLQFGHSEFLLRLPSVILGVSCIFLFFRLLQRVVGLRGALYGSAILALNSRTILYSQDARMYALAMFLTLTSVYSFLRIVEGDGRAWLGAYLLLTLLLSYNQVLYVAVFAGQVLVASILWFRARADDRPPLRRLLLVQAAVVPLLTPLFLRVLLVGGSRANLYSWIEKPDWPWMRDFLTWPEVSLTLVAVPGLWALWLQRRRLQPKTDVQRALLWLGLLYAAIWPGALVLARLGIVNLLVPRYLLPGLLGILFVTAFCASRANDPLLRSGLTSYVVLLVFFQAAVLSKFGTWFEIHYNQQWRAADSWVEAHYRPGDVVLVRSGLTQTRKWSPDETGSQELLTAALTGFYTSTHMTSVALPYSAQELNESPYGRVALEASRQATRVVVLVNLMPEGWQWQTFEDWLQQPERPFSEIDRASFGFVRVRVYSARPPTPVHALNPSR